MAETVMKIKSVADAEQFFTVLRNWGYSQIKVTDLSAGTVLHVRVMNGYLINYTRFAEYDKALAAKELFKHRKLFNSVGKKNIQCLFGVGQSM